MQQPNDSFDSFLTQQLAGLQTVVDLVSASPETAGLGDAHKRDLAAALVARQARLVSDVMKLVERNPRNGIAQQYHIDAALRTLRSNEPDLWMGPELPGYLWRLYLAAGVVPTDSNRHSCQAVMSDDRRREIVRLRKLIRERGGVPPEPSPDDMPNVTWSPAQFAEWKRDIEVKATRARQLQERRSHMHAAAISGPPRRIA